MCAKTGKKGIPVTDQRFKEIVRDRDILASIIKGVIPEFGNMSREEIYSYLELEKDGHTVCGRNVELISQSNGPIYMDSVFHIWSLMFSAYSARIFDVKSGSCAGNVPILS